MSTKWHTPGLGEVHSEDHKEMIYCESGTEDQELPHAVDDKLARRVADALNDPTGWHNFNLLEHITDYLIERDILKTEHTEESDGPLAAALNIIDSFNTAADVMDMALCERENVVLRVGQTYRFRPVGDCARCAELAAQAVEAYSSIGVKLDLTPILRHSSD